MGRSSPTPEASAELRAADPEAALLAALRAGDEDAFATLVTRYHASLKRVARAYVSTDAVAEEVVQRRGWRSSAASTASSSARA
jgi:hypothetical protein